MKYKVKDRGIGNEKSHATIKVQPSLNEEEARLPNKNSQVNIAPQTFESEMEEPHGRQVKESRGDHSSTLKKGEPSGSIISKSKRSEEEKQTSQ